MEFKHSKYVRIICDLKVGDVITTDVHYSLIGKKQSILDIKRGPSESGIMLKITGYEGYIDSNWVEKV